MQNQENCHENVWILSGTSEGPELANLLINLNFVVFVSVVSLKASEAYPKNLKLHIITGRIKDEEEIKKIILKNNINYVIDATHPFALIISKQLSKACNHINKPLYRYERNFEKLNSNSIIINDFKGIGDIELKNKNILLAVGSRSLNEIASYYIEKKANVYARIIATPESIKKGFSSCVKNSNLAILNPSKVKEKFLESYLCEFWKIDIILCRDSGGYSQILWEKISCNSRIKLYLLKRPEIVENQFVFSTFQELKKIIDINWY